MSGLFKAKLSKKNPKTENDEAYNAFYDFDENGSIDFETEEVTYEPLKEDELNK